ncbi:IKBD-like protein, partial [Mya arenaria]
VTQPVQLPLNQTTTRPFNQPGTQPVQLPWNQNQTTSQPFNQPLNQPGTQPVHQTLTTSISQHCTQSLQQGFRSPVKSQTVQQSIQTLPVTLNPLYITPFHQSQPRIQLSHQTSNQPNRPILPKPTQSVNAIQTPRLKSTPTHSAVERDKRVAPTRNVGKNKQKEDKARRDISKLTETQLQGVDPEKGDTIVHEYACRGPHENYHLQALLERLKQKNMINIMINSKNKKNQTALYCAVSLNYDKVIKTLLKFGADPNIKAQNGDEQSAPIHIAACSGTAKTIDALLEALNIDIDSINSYGQTALHCAIVQQFVAQKEKDGSRKVAMEKLLQKRANHTLQDTKGRTPLIYCVLQKQKDLLTTLE